MVGRARTPNSSGSSSGTSPPAPSVGPLCEEARKAGRKRFWSLFGDVMPGVDAVAACIRGPLAPDLQRVPKLKAAEILADKEEMAEHAVTTAGRIGAKSGEVSELTTILPLKPNGAARLRKFFDLLGGNLAGAGQVGTLHNMRFAFLDNDTKLLFATAFDGEWDPYIDDFATKIPDMMDFLFTNVEGWPGITSPDVKDFIVKYQIPAEAWFVAHPNLTVAEGHRLKRQEAAVQRFLSDLN